MATNDVQAGRDTPANPDDLLPETSVRSLEEYRDMQQAIGDRTRFEIVYRLVNGGDTSSTELDETMDVDDSTLHSHRTKLVDVGLVEKRKRTERTSAGFHAYYRATILAKVVLEHGVEELLRREWDFLEASNGSTNNTS